VLLPGEVDQLLAGQWETLRGLVYPYQAVRELRRPSELYDALGLGFAVSGIAGSETLAFNRDAESVEVLRCAGLRQDDLVTPIDTDVKLPAGTVPLPLVRHHRRPWTGTGEAPGSTSDNVIEEHEILGYASVGIPHLAEIWRLQADGSEEYVSTYNARNGQWVGDTSPRQAPVGRRIDNGAYAGLSDGTVFRTVVLTDRESVLIAYGVSAPEHFEQVHDGSCRTIVSNSDIINVTGVATIGDWRSLPIQLLSRQGDMVLIDYAGDDPAAAAAAGFLQTNQGQWQPRWVEHTEVTDLQQLERAYALPRPAEAWHVAPQAPESGPDAPHDDPLTEEVALGAAR
jgi:predicted secreted protein